MSTFTPTLESRWKTTKTNFETMTGKHKPKEKLAGVAKTGHTGLSKSLKEAEAAAKAVSIAVSDMNGQKIKPEKAKAKLVEYENCHKTFQKSSKTYLDLLASEIQKEKDLENDAKSIWERGLKMLQKELMAYDSIFIADIAKEKQNFADDLKTKTTEEKIILLFKTNMKKALDNASAWAAKGKALGAAIEGKDAATVKKILDSYNDQIVQKAGRDVGMQLELARKVNGLRATPDAAIASLGGWGDQKTHKLPNNATPADLRAKVAEFNTAIKAVRAWFDNATR
jgi:hypothetical protein